MDQETLDKIRSLCLDLGEVESEIELATSRLNFQRQSIRDEIATLLAVSGEDNVHVPGFGQVIFTKPSSTPKYNTKLLTRLVHVLRQRGETDLANDIEACKEWSERSGYLMIKKDKR